MAETRASTRGPPTRSPSGMCVKRRRRQLAATLQAAWEGKPEAQGPLVELALNRRAASGMVRRRGAGVGAVPDGGGPGGVREAAD